MTKKITIKNNKLSCNVEYWRIVLDTRVGELEYSYTIGQPYDDDNYQLEKGSDKDLAGEELDEIDDILTNAIKGKDTCNAKHLATQKAIKILNYLERKCELNLSGLTYPEFERTLTKIINSK